MNLNHAISNPFYKSSDLQRGSEYSEHLNTRNLWKLDFLEFTFQMVTITWKLDKTSPDFRSQYMEKNGNFSVSK
jgi:hypothetical protein